MKQRGLQLCVKLALDRLVGFAILVVAAPLMFLVAAAIRITMGRPVLFRQTRPGYQERLFVLYKFRTMAEARNAEGRLLPDHERITRLGRLLRATSLDELPQLWNVVRGDLSLVGPRPLLPEYLPRYTPEQRVRHDVRPGITGWAQIHGRNAVGWRRKFELDAWYVNHWSVWLDLKILVATLSRVLLRRDTAHPGHATMPEFTGTGETSGGRGEASRDE